jgi:hypothetical protein
VEVAHHTPFFYGTYPVRLVNGINVAEFDNKGWRGVGNVTGKSAAYYTALFPTHVECAIKKRNDEASELMRRTREHPPFRLCTANAFIQGGRV